VDALSLNHNVIRIAISPAESAGQPATIAVSPESSYLRIQGRVVTSTRGTRLRAATFFAGPRTGVSVSGRIHAGSETLLFWRRVYHPALFTGHSLRQELEAAGIRVSFAVRKHATPPGTPILLEHRSQSLTRIIQLGNKTSNNLVAEHLFLALGADVFGPPATFDKGRRAVDAYLRNIGVQPGTYRIENGSGLSRRNRIRPADLVRVLETSATDLSLGPDLLASLPVAGRDGTLLRRFEGSPAVGHVRAKTGTLGGVSCLTGYAEYGGRHLVFTFFTGRVRRLPQARRLQVSMAEALVEDLHARWPDEQAPAHATAGGPTLHEPSSSAPVLTAAPGVSPPRPEGGARSGARLER
jgi:D-alanyl-D-alanine carboxypeptidase/D-alanyl-D-alanine-endopeptidase (penicillin-binding protein 4)